MDKFTSGARYLARTAIAAYLMSAAALSLAPPAAAADEQEAVAREAWREAIVRTEVPGEGCFYAEYPSTAWVKTGCTAAPNIPYLPRGGARGQTVGNGVDYAAGVSGLMSKSVGSFPKVTGVTSEEDSGYANDYSLQLNSNFMTTAACKGISGCLDWQQFVYSSGSEVAFMQYWLINYGTCPSGWNTYSPDCYKNSAAVLVPTAQPITELAHLKLSGTAVAGGRDTLVFTAESMAYSTSGKDSVVDLATGWNESEFNVIGDGGGSEAVFNTGSLVRVKIAVTNGTTSAPTCVADAGTTGETNNLNLKGCTTYSGATPSIAFTERN